MDKIWLMWCKVNVEWKDTENKIIKSTCNFSLIYSFFTDLYLLLIMKIEFVLNFARFFPSEYITISLQWLWHSCLRLQKIYHDYNSVNLWFWIQVFKTRNLNKKKNDWAPCLSISSTCFSSWIEKIWNNT